MRSHQIVEIRSDFQVRDNRHILEAESRTGAVEIDFQNSSGNTRLQLYEIRKRAGKRIITRQQVANIENVALLCVKIGNFVDSCIRAEVEHVRTRAAAQDVVPKPSIKEVAAAHAFQGIAKVVAGDPVVTRVTVAGKCSSGQNKVFNIRRQRVANRAVNFVNADLVRSAFLYAVARIVDKIKVRSGSADHFVSAESAIEHVIALATRQYVIEGIAGSLVAALHQNQFFDVAAKSVIDEALDGSHISVMTGVHRKEVKRLRARRHDGLNLAPPEMSAGAELVATWMAKNEYLDSDGRPLQLPYFSKDIQINTFSSLAEKISKDIAPRTLLDELERLGALSYDRLTGLVSLHSEAFLPKENTDNKIHYFGQNCGDHAEAAVKNIFTDKPPYMDRSVYHNELTPESVDELQALAAEAGMKALRQVNRRAFELSERDKGKTGACERLNFGVFFFRSHDTPGDGE